jgi:hypothetical protein
MPFLNFPSFFTGKFHSFQKLLSEASNSQGWNKRHQAQTSCFEYASSTFRHVHHNNGAIVMLFLLQTTSKQ